jgi:hypothetical protein
MGYARLLYNNKANVAICNSAIKILHFDSYILYEK